ncbi:MAG: type IV pilin protein [Pseudomonadota bacterium]|nr:type IV pilin protein [Pseudomonadota bacterium]
MDATSRLADFRVRMEQFFLDNRTYLAGGGGCGQPDIAAVNSSPFGIACAAIDARTYTVTATGQASQNMSNFSYSIDQNGVKRTVNLPSGWTGKGTVGCWVVRKDGSCV